MISDVLLGIHLYVSAAKYTVSVAMATDHDYLCIQCSLELEHVGILLWVDVVVGKDHREAVNGEPEVVGWASTAAQSHSAVYLIV